MPYPQLAANSLSRPIHTPVGLTWYHASGNTTRNTMTSHTGTVCRTIYANTCRGTISDISSLLRFFAHRKPDGRTRKIWWFTHNFIPLKFRYDYVLCFSVFLTYAIHLTILKTLRKPSLASLTIFLQNKMSAYSVF